MFSCVKTKINVNFVVNLAEIQKEATIHFLLFDESHFSNICTLYYVKIEYNFPCDYRKLVGTKQVIFNTRRPHTNAKAFKTLSSI